MWGGVCRGGACVVCISPQLVSSAFLSIFFFTSKASATWVGLDGQRHPPRSGRMDGPWPASCAPWPVSLYEAHWGPWELGPSSCLNISGRGPFLLWGHGCFPSLARQERSAAPWKDEVSYSKSQLLPNKGRES